MTDQMPDQAKPSRPGAAFAAVIGGALFLLAIPVFMIGFFGKPRAAGTMAIAVGMAAIGGFLLAIAVGMDQEA